MTLTAHTRVFSEAHDIHSIHATSLNRCTVDALLQLWAVWGSLTSPEAQSFDSTAMPFIPVIMPQCCKETKALVIVKNEAIFSEKAQKMKLILPWVLKGEDHVTLLVFQLK